MGLLGVDFTGLVLDPWQLDGGHQSKKFEGAVHIVGEEFEGGDDSDTSGGGDIDKITPIVVEDRTNIPSINGVWGP